MTDVRDVVIFGAGEIAELVAFYLTHDSPYRVVAFTVDGAFLTTNRFSGAPVVAFEELARSFRPEDHLGFAAVSYARLNRLRAEKRLALKTSGYRPLSYVSSKATVWPDLSIGEHCLILEGNNIQPRARIGSNVFLWSGNHIGHHAVLEDDVFVAGHVAIGGGATIGAGAFIGGLAGIAHRVTIGPRCVIGAHALITADTLPGSVHAVRGTPRSPVPSDRLRGL